MMIAIPSLWGSPDSPVAPVLGRAEYLCFYDTCTHRFFPLASRAVQAANGAGVLAAQLVADHNAGVLITCGCGENARRVLRAAGIAVYQARRATVEQNLRLLQSGSLSPLTAPGHRMEVW